jgi:hypothetical protein
MLRKNAAQLGQGDGVCGFRLRVGRGRDHVEEKKKK